MANGLWAYEVGFASVSAVSAAAAWRWTGARLELAEPAAAPPADPPPVSPPVLARATQQNGYSNGGPNDAPAASARQLEDADRDGGASAANPRAFAPGVPTSATLGPWSVRWAARGGDVHWISAERVGVLLFSHDQSAADFVGSATAWLGAIGDRPDDSSLLESFTTAVLPDAESRTRCGAVVFWDAGGWAMLQDSAVLAQPNQPDAATGPVLAPIKSSVALISTEARLLSSRERRDRFFLATQIPGPALRVIEQFESTSGADPIIWVTQLPALR